MSASALSGIAAVGHALKESVPEITQAYVHRLSTDAALPEARRLPALDLEDHAASLLVDIAMSLIATAETDIDVTDLLRDGSEIQRVISALHGAQRARLSWNRDALVREFQVLGEEVESAVRRAAGPDAQVDSGLDLVRRAILQAQQISLQAWGDSA